ncbi:MAG: Hdr-like menaquinol oxidoreductase cytochrome c subunit [Gammaproteobacteria bacterium]|nr:Hdr-like menaquinol oxidoreductase cytochrome c subunit [Gammaproteobacteria bacterium]
MFFSLALNRQKQQHFSIMAVAVLFCLFISLPVFADVPFPKVPQAKGKKCVEETAFMRRNHMELLMHQRDDTMRKGIRTTKHSLQGCLDCHAVYNDENMPVTIQSEKHFCNSCHNYAAVKIDCFGCHNSKPFVKKQPRTEKPEI